MFCTRYPDRSMSAGNQDTVHCTAVGYAEAGVGRSGTPLYQRVSLFPDSHPSRLRQTAAASPRHSYLSCANLTVCIFNNSISHLPSSVIRSTSTVLDADLISDNIQSRSFPKSYLFANSYCHPTISPNQATLKMMNKQRRMRWAYSIEGGFLLKPLPLRLLLVPLLLHTPSTTSPAVIVLMLLHRPNDRCKEDDASLGIQ